MTLAHSYARALFELVSHNEDDAALYLKNLVAALRRRGHEGLLRTIFSEYELLALKEKRLKMHARVTPEKERTRVLLQLYKKLTTTSHE